LKDEPKPSFNQVPLFVSHTLTSDNLPIVNDQKVMGLISIGDVVREMIAYQKSMIEQLQSYIAG
jgi:hypothetical protein